MSAPTDADLLGTVQSIASTYLGLERRLAAGDRLVEDLGLDSLQRMTLAIEIENELRICLDPEDEAQIWTVSDLVSVLRRKTAGRGSSGDEGTP